MATATDRFHEEMAKQQAYQRSDEYLSQFCGDYRACPGGVVRGEFTIAINPNPNAGPMRDYVLVKQNRNGTKYPVTVKWLTSGLDAGSFARIPDEAIARCDACGDPCDNEPMQTPSGLRVTCDDCAIAQYDGPTPEDLNTWGNRGGASRPVTMGQMLTIAHEMGFSVREVYSHRRSR